MAPFVRRVAAHEGLLLRSIRLRALADSPSAFASTFDGEAAMTAQQWDERCRSGATGSDRANFVAEFDELIVGLVGAFRRDPGDTSVELVSMWTAPEARRSGVGHLLIDAVIRWADESASPVELWVVQGNTAAETLYRSRGFEPVGDYEPMPSDPCRHELRMRRR